MDAGVTRRSGVGGIGAGILLHGVSGARAERKYGSGVTDGDCPVNRADAKRTERFACSFGRHRIAGQCPTRAVEGGNSQSLERSVVVGLRADRDTGQHQRHSFAIE
jgi:hypothetical protein